jgi:gamma-glutamylcyclotransferase (GGCT)/AIG2-like uncharacterized protein YtfP
MIYAFVYGTLRIGEYNYRWASDDVVEEIPNVVTSGGLYFVSERGGYPVAKLDEAGIIKGDLLVYPDDSLDWQRIHDMESGAGYELREIPVLDNDGGIHSAVAWHFLHEPRGAKIEDGDWARAHHLSEIS